MVVLKCTLDDDGRTDVHTAYHMQDQESPTHTIYIGHDPYLQFLLYSGGLLSIQQNVQIPLVQKEKRKCANKLEKEPCVATEKVITIKRLVMEIF